jgi:hypothetical protein
MRRLALALAFACSSVPVVLAMHGCSSDGDDVDPDAGMAYEDGVPEVGRPDVGSSIDAGEAGNDAGSDAAKSGETCTGFGKGSPCGDAGLPLYGYICVNGGPPGFVGCVQASASAFGETYCCPSNDCVAEPDQDPQCTGVSGKPHLYQCPPDGTDGGSVAPTAGCAAKSLPGSPYAYYCCP